MRRHSLAGHSLLIAILLLLLPLLLLPLLLLVVLCLRLLHLNVHVHAGHFRFHDWLHHLQYAREQREKE
jgi:hypothetical protein